MTLLVIYNYLLAVIKEDFDRAFNLEIICQPDVCPAGYLCRNGG